MDAGKITGIYERKLIRQMVHTDQQLVAAHTNLINRTVPILKQYRSSGSGVIIRSPELDTQIQNELLKFESSIRTAIKASQEAAWNLADEKTDQIINSFIQGMPLSEISMEGLYRRNMDAFQSFQSRKYDGLQLSDRIWNMTKQNSDLLNNYVDNALITGRSAGDMSRDIREILNEPNRQFRRVRNPRTGKLELSREAKKYKPGTGKYRSSAQNAKRLARTETNMAYRTSDQERWKSLDFVLGYEVKIGNRHPKPDICDHAAGRYPKNFKFVGWHPQCLCYAIPILPTKDEFMDNLVDGTPLSGYIEDVPDGMKSYVSDNVSSIAGYKRQPFWVQDNFKGGKITGGVKPDIITTTKPAIKPQAAVTARSAVKDFTEIDAVNNLDELNFLNTPQVTGRDTWLETLAEKQGFAGTPTLVNAEEFEKHTGDILYRGVYEKWQKDQFKSGDYFGGTGVYANGTYTASGDPAWAEKVAKTYGGTSTETMIQMKMSANFKTVDIYDLMDEMKKFDADEKFGNSALNRLMDAGKIDFDQKMILNDYRECLNDAGRFATMKGYDAISVPIKSDKNQFYTVVLNRTKLIVLND